MHCASCTAPSLQTTDSIRCSGYPQESDWLSCVASSAAVRTRQRCKHPALIRLFTSRVGGLRDDDSSEDALQALQGGVKLMARLLLVFPQQAAMNMTKADPSATTVLLEQIQARSSAETTVGVPTPAASLSGALADARPAVGCAWWILCLAVQHFEQQMHFQGTSVPRSATVCDMLLLRHLLTPVPCGDRRSSVARHVATGHGRGAPAVVAMRRGRRVNLSAAGAAHATGAAASAALQACWPAENITANTVLLSGLLH